MIRLLNGDCLEVLAGMASESVDACVTDPPYHLASIVKRFGGANSAPVKVSEFFQENGQTKGSSPYLRSSTGFMGKTWDGGDVAFRPETWAAVLRVLKPGAHLAAFGAPKNYHRLACAIEDAGFEVRDSLMWLFGSGFPKSHNVQQAINKAAAGFPHGGADPRSPNHGKFKSGVSEENPEGRGFGAGAAGFMDEMGTGRGDDDDGPWQGWGTALKPAYEPIILARKPLIGTVAQNVVKHGTGAINIDATRVGDGESRRSSTGGMARKANPIYGAFANGEVLPIETTLGRWPANVVHDGSDEVLAGFPTTGPSSGRPRNNSTSLGSSGAGVFGKGAAFVGAGHADNGGSAARFFYCAKANAKDRAGSKHPTVKPIALMRWLCRLVTPPGGVILDPFAGTGTTGQAAQEEGFGAILIEREAEYRADIRRRLGLMPAEIEEALA